MKHHAIERTSPNGQPFRGTCWQCGRKDLPVSAALDECDNPSGMSNEQSILRAIEGPDADCAVAKGDA